MTDLPYKGFRHGVRTVTCERAASLLEFIAVLLAAEKERPSLGSLELIELGSAYVNDARSLNPAQALKPGDLIRVHTDPRRFSRPTDLIERILEDSASSMLVDKPAGLPADALVDNLRENLLSFLEELRGQNLMLTNRLTPESEGLMLLAKNLEAQNEISRAFKEGRIRRRFVAYVDRPVITSTAITITSCARQDAATNLLTENRKTWTVSGPPLNLYYRLEIDVTMARPRDVRAQLASLGAPVIGDKAFGSHYELTDSESGRPAMAFRALSLSVLP